jgi:hypothetical protein
MDAHRHIHLLDNLQALLERQIKLAQDGNTSSLEVLSEQADSLARKIADTGILELPEFGDRRKQLQKLYDSLCLAITAQKADVCEKLSRVRKARKTVEVYRNSV